MRLDDDECRRRLSGARSAVLAVNDADGPPLAVPITFAALDDGVVFAVDHKPKSTTRLRRLRLIEADPWVAVLADEYDDDWDRLWWVRADGVARVLDDADPYRTQAVAALAARYRQYAGHPPEHAVVAIEVQRWSGWAFRR